MKGEKRFDIDLEYGKKGEAYVRRLLDTIGNDNGYVEVKSKRDYDLDLWVETAVDNNAGHYSPSGITTTKSDTFFFPIGRHRHRLGVYVATDLLRVAIEDGCARTRYRDNPDGLRSVGRVVSFGRVLFLAKKDERGEF